MLTLVDEYTRECLAIDVGREVEFSAIGIYNPPPRGDREDFR